MRNTVLLMLTGLLLTSQVFGRDDKCPTWPTYYIELFCNCGEQLNNLEITVPKGMKVMSACLHDDHDHSSPGRLIDLSKEKVSLDKYKNGNIPYGTIYLSGEMTVNGKITVDPGPAGNIWFYPEWEFSQLRTAFSKAVSSFKFLDENQAAAFKINERLLRNGCSIAPAKIQISGLRVLIVDHKV